MSGTVLIVEDDSHIAGLVEIHLKDLGYQVEKIEDGASGLKQALKSKYVLIILDIMLPSLNGVEVCKKIREQDKNTPILMLSSKADLVDVVVGLEVGADDYLTKPFRVEELIARIKALLRRVDWSSDQQENAPNQKLIFAELEIDCERRKVSRANQDISLTARQFDLLAFLASRAGRPFKRQELLNYVWGYENSGYEHTVDTHVNRLRSKIEPDPANPKFILTVWGVGYRFAENAELDKAE